MRAPLVLVACYLTFYPCKASAWSPFSTRKTWNASCLFRTANNVRKKVPVPPSIGDDKLSFPSVYNNGNGMRGFCNWLLPGRLMIGQYPGCAPETHGPNHDEVKEHIRLLVQDAGVNLFCSLQSEIPAQTDYVAWNENDGQIYLSEYLRAEFSHPFTHYAPMVQQAGNAILDGMEPEFLHHPIEDLSIPNSGPIQHLLEQLLQALENDKVVYLHCWGGRGRAGLVGACLLSLLYPELDSNAILDLVQSGYDSRAGATGMPPPLSRSPQTKQQRHFVRMFVQERQQQQR